MLTSPTSTYGWVVFECSIIATWLKRLKRGFVGLFGFCRINKIFVGKIRLWTRLMM